MATQVESGDLSLARQELSRAEAQGQDVSGAKAELYFREGLLASAVTQKTLVNPGIAKKRRSQAVAAFTNAARLLPDAAIYYNLGLSYVDLDRKESAIQAFRQAEQLGDGETSIDASKQIRRLDPNGRIAAFLVTETAPGASPGGMVQIAPGKRPNWVMCRNGVIALVVGLVLSGVYIGIPILLIGIGMIVYAFAVGLPT